MATNQDQIDPGLLAQLLAEQYAQRRQLAPEATQSAPAARTRRAARSDYGESLYKAALVVAILVMLGVWYAGATFTLAAIASWGLDLTAWGLLAWLLPLAVTALEIGTLAGRARLPALWVVWAGVLAFDIASTAIGLIDLADGRRVLGHVFTAADPTSMAIGGIIGMGIALGPEPSIKALVRELFH